MTVRFMVLTVLWAAIPEAAVGQPAAAPPKPAADEPLQRKVQEARDRAVQYLKTTQKKPDGDNWNSALTELFHPGGTTALTVVALLEAGVKSDDEGVARAIKYLRTVGPKHTYVVALQTQVFCRADPKGLSDLILRNVRWLEQAAVWHRGKLQGWSYAADGKMRPDNSNTEFAVAGLYAAHKAGVKGDNLMLWHEIADYYIREQTKDGGWVYQKDRSPNKPTPAMSAAGITGLLHAKNVLGDDDWRIGKAAELGYGWLAGQFDAAEQSRFYNLHAVSALGRASGRADLGTKDKPIDWYKRGAEWLIANQKADGSWPVEVSARADRYIDSRPEYATPMALRFLVSRAK